jgi:hypothetical protein
LESSSFESVFSFLDIILKVGLVEGVVHRARGLLAHPWRPMAVKVEREADAGVSRESLDVLGMDAFGEQQRRAGVAQQIVPPYFGKAGAPQ